MRAQVARGLEVPGAVCTTTRLVAQHKRSNGQESPHTLHGAFMGPREALHVAVTTRRYRDDVRMWLEGGPAVSANHHPPA